MIKAKILIDEIEKLAPQKYAADWDNVGLMVGSLNTSVNKAMVCLDVTPKVVEQAIKNGCELIISHHPLLFKGLTVIDYDSVKGSMLKSIIENKITVFSAHTNLDSAICGINSILAQKFDLANVTVLDTNITYPEVGIGRIGDLKAELSFYELCKKTKKILGTETLKTVCVNPNTLIKKLCVASGSCGDLIQLASEKGADAIITADVKYHEALDAADFGISVIDAGHYPTEIPVCEIFKNTLNKFDIEIISAISEDIFKFV